MTKSQRDCRTAGALRWWAPLCGPVLTVPGFDIDATATALLDLCEPAAQVKYWFPYNMSTGGATMPALPLGPSRMHPSVYV